MLCVIHCLVRSMTSLCYELWCETRALGTDTYTGNKSLGTDVIKLFSCSTQLSMKFILLINVKMPTIVGILTFISRINTASKNFKARKIFNFQHFSFYEQLKFHAHLR